jgi:hypothetical protein
VSQFDRATQLRACFLAALECAEACWRAEVVCVRRNSGRDDPQRACLPRDCADLATTAARLLSRNSPRRRAVWAACIECAHDCAADCLVIAAGDETLLECAAACQRCVQNWQELEALRAIVPGEPASGAAA